MGQDVCACLWGGGGGGGGNLPWFPVPEIMGRGGQGRIPLFNDLTPSLQFLYNEIKESTVIFIS